MMLPERHWPLLSALAAHAANEYRNDRPIPVQTGGATRTGRLVYTTAEVTPANRTADPPLPYRGYHPGLSPYRQQAGRTATHPARPMARPSEPSIPALRTALAPAIDFGVPILAVTASSPTSQPPAFAISIGDRTDRTVTTYLVPLRALRAGHLDRTALTPAPSQLTNHLAGRYVLQSLIHHAFDQPTQDWAQFSQRLRMNTRHRVTALQATTNPTT